MELLLLNISLFYTFIVPVDIYDSSFDLKPHSSCVKKVPRGFVFQWTTSNYFE